MATRIQRQRVRGWRMPEGAIYVGRPSKWGNPYRWRSREALARVPALDGSPWEYEDRISAAGMRHDYFHPDGRITAHTIRYMTLAECVDLFRQALVTPTRQIHLSWRPDPNKAAGWLTVEDAIDDLRGRDLACYCPSTGAVTPTCCWRWPMANERLLHEFGKRVRALREIAALTQAQLAARVAVSRTSITNIEAGRQEPGLAVVINLAHALSVSIDCLLSRRSHRP